MRAGQASRTLIAAFSLFGGSASLASAATTAPDRAVTLLFNDRHVLARPIGNRRGRVLAALVRRGAVLVPLRSVFEAMGGHVAFDSATKTVRVTKPGAAVELVVGKPQVVFNGEARPLDVPPKIVDGTILVPLRVISEGLGAFVQWVPQRNLVAIRYARARAESAALPPPALAAATSTAAPVPSPAPAVPEAARPPAKERFLVGDFLFSPKIYNEFSPGATAHGNFAFRGGAEVTAGRLPLLLEGAFEQRSYAHRGDARFDRGGNAPPFDGLAGPVCSFPEPRGAGGDAGCVTTIGRNGASFVPSFTAREQSVDAKVGVKVADPRIYVGLGYTRATGNYGYPQIAGVGIGAEKLPDLDQRASFYGSIFYYPGVSGRYAGAAGTDTLSYHLVRYQVGGTLGLGSSPSFVDFGYKGDRATASENAPADQTHSGPYVGLGLHF